MTTLPKWFEKRRKWLQCAAVRLHQQHKFTEKDIHDFAELCLQEARGNPPEEVFNFPNSAFSQGTTDALQIRSIEDVRGINALAPRNPLKFAKNKLMIVYGDNGSGKTGYVRLLKHVCGARNPGVLLPNVYNPQNNEQSACIHYVQNETPDGQDEIKEKYTWTGAGGCDALSKVDIFDTSFGKVFIGSEGEVSYEPPALIFFTSLINACDEVRNVLIEKAVKYQTRKPQVPLEMKGTPEAGWYESIGHKTEPGEISQHCSFGSSDVAAMQLLLQRLAEKDPAKKAKKIQENIRFINILVQDAQKHFNQLSDDKVQSILAIKKNAIFKKAVAEAAAKKVFSSCDLKEIGSKVWRDLWEAARNYSVTAAYKGAEYPRIDGDARCVLCQQSLTEQAKNRFVSFELFVKGQAQKDANIAHKAYVDAIQGIDAIPADDVLIAKIAATGIPTEISHQILNFFTMLRSRKAQLEKLGEEENISALLPPSKWIDDIDIKIKQLNEQATIFFEDSKKNNHDEINLTLKKLQRRKWLSDQREAINKEVDRLKVLVQFEDAKKLTSTSSLSSKKNELADELITNEFVRRFNDALEYFKASHVKVELVKTRTVKGKVFHTLKLRGASGHNIAEVLSEGENRIVSIAAFLADITGEGNRAPLIFDDPISSLDLSYEEAVVQKLCKLSLGRQVVIFTHRVTLLAMAQDYAEELGIEADVVCICRESWGNGEPNYMEHNAMKPAESLHQLIDVDFVDAKDDYRDKGIRAYRLRAFDICRNFRILLEKMIEHVLIGGVVLRYRKDIQTKGRLGKLVLVKECDCKRLERLMTKYSKYMHSHSFEIKVTPPDPDELLDDLQELQEWFVNFKKRIKELKN